MIISHHPPTMWRTRELQNVDSWPHPCWDTAWRYMRTLVMLVKYDSPLVENTVLYAESLHRSLVLVATGQCSLGGEHVDKRPAWAQLWSFYLCLPDRWWWAVPSLPPDAAGILRLWFYIKAYIWMKEKRLSNPKQPILHWQAKRCKIQTREGKAIAFEIKPWRKGSQVFILYHSTYFVASSLEPLFQNLH